MPKFSGSEWVESNYKCKLHSNVADIMDLIGQAWKGIFVDFNSDEPDSYSEEEEIEIENEEGEMELQTIEWTYTSQPCLELLFFKRQREGDFSTRHPTIEQAILRVREEKGLPPVV